MLPIIVLSILGSSYIATGNGSINYLKCDYRVNLNDSFCKVEDSVAICKVKNILDLPDLLNQGINITHL